MKISSHGTCFFKAKIIDCHVHRGTDKSVWNNEKFPTEKLDEFIKKPLSININGEKQTDNVVKILVSSIDGLAQENTQKEYLNANGLSKNNLKPEDIIFAKNEIEANLDMINKYKKDSFYAVMAVCQPSKTNGSAQNIQKLISDNPNSICGLKFHPQEMMLNADSPLYDKYMKLAKKENLPCLFHSQVNTNHVDKTLNWSDPEYIYKLAKRHPDVPIIMGHCGAGNSEAHSKAIDILEKSIKNKDAKLYVDISWVDFYNDLPAENPKSIINVIDRMKKLNALDRILFGTDAPLGCYGEEHVLNKTAMSPKEAYELTISKIKTAIKKQYGKEADSIIDKIFYKNANELFFEKKSIQQKKSKNNGIIIGLMAGISFLAILVSLLLKHKNNNNNKEK